MRASSVVVTLVAAALSGAQTTGKLGDAAVVSNNPIGAEYIAVLPNNPDNAVRGSVVAQTAPSGMGVRIAITITGLPTSGGPFLYHIHDQPVPPNGNCTGTLAHLDPYQRGEDPPCDATAPQTCQVGDLSGKHGHINGTAFSANYLDVYASLVPGLGSFFGNRSVVVHYANKTRITCANFVSAAALANSSYASGSSSSASGTSASGLVVATDSGTAISTVLSTVSAASSTALSVVTSSSAALGSATASATTRTASAAASSSSSSAPAATGGAVAAWMSTGALVLAVAAAMM